MKKNIYPIIALLALCFCMLSACTDDLAGGWTASDGAVSMKITLNLPASSSAQTRADAAADELAAERRMDVEGMHILVFEDDVLKEDIKDKQLGEEVDGKRILTAKSTETYKNRVNVVVLANMNKNGIAFNSNEYIGKSKKELYEALKYTYGDKAWDVVDNEQYIPMWGAFTLTPSSGDNNVNVSLYRAVSKMNVLVGNGAGLDNFTLTSVRVYYANQEGYAAPLVEPNGTDAVESPSIGTDFTQSDVLSPLIYNEEGGTKALKNRIYLPESNNKELAEGKKPLCLVVGGKYTGAGLVDSGKDSYYRIDFKDKDGIYDALRNHLYIFDINKVSSPGTTTPEEALDNAVVGMDVTIESWNDTYMNGLTSQYSLVTDKSRASFSKEGDEEITITVSSDYTEPWTVVDVMGEWFKPEVKGNKIILTTTANYGASRIGSFCIQAGQLKKQIFVDQAQPGTANCYLVGTGEYEMSVVVKGNGTSGLTAESKGGGTVKLEESATLEPAYLSVIWETEAGLITLIDADGSVSDKANYNTATGILKYRVKDNPKANYGKLDGGNALIGAFNENDEVIWSWHIWVCPKMLASNNNNDEVWKLTGYKVMDRNLGALSNEPGVGSLGLLYQWGRKDPFIGAAEISDKSLTMPTVNHFTNFRGASKNHDWLVAGDNPESKTVEFTVKNPTKLIHDGLSKGDKGAFLWGTDGGLAAVGIKDLGKKTIYDPCPIGYRVPPVDAFVFKGTTTYRPFWHETKPYAMNIKLYDVVDWQFGRGSTHFELEAGADKIWSGPMWISVPRVDNGKEFYLEEGKTFKIIKGEPNSVTPYKELAILKKSSETKNWDENLVYIPNNLSAKSTSVWSANDYLYIPNNTWTEADYYGFYLNYNEVSVPKMKDQGKDYYTLAPNQSNITWLPLSGAYDPATNEDLTFKGVKIEQGSSLTVNSFIWTNSSVTSNDGIIRPGALFLHGANPKNMLDGRHIHALNRDDLKAEPHYAGAVRCVRDEKKDFAEENIVPEEINLKNGSGEIFKSTIYAINESWRVIDPGAPWVRITPDRGVADKGKGTEVTFTAAKANDGSAPRTTIMKIQIGDKVHDVSIEQKAN